MKDQENNLLIQLHRWARRQDENFTSEAFAHVLNHLLIHEPRAAVTLVKKITNGLFNLHEQDVEHMEIATQHSIVEGRPDIVIMFPNHLVYIEVKVESGLGHRQLERYRLALEQSGHQHTRLILLSRYPFSTTDVEQPDYAIRWYQIAEWLEAEVRSGLSNQHSYYVVQQFIGFLQHRNITRALC